VWCVVVAVVVGVAAQEQLRSITHTHLSFSSYIDYCWYGGAPQRGVVGDTDDYSAMEIARAR